MCGMPEHPHTNRGGFTLVQLSVILTVAAIVMTSMLSGREAGDYNQHILDDIAKLNKVEAGMATFMSSHGRRPCPADGQYDVNNTSFGLEAGATVANTTGCK